MLPISIAFLLKLFILNLLFVRRSYDYTVLELSVSPAFSLAVAFVASASFLSIFEKS